MLVILEQVGAVVHRLVAQRGGHAAVVVAAFALAGIDPAHPQALLLQAVAVAVDRHGDRQRALAFHAQHMVLGHLERIGSVELGPDRLAARRNHVLDRGGRLGRQDHQMVADLGGGGDRGLAVGVIAFVPAGGRQEDRRVVFHPENLGRHVDLADVDQTSRPQLEFLEAFAIGPQGDVVVDAAGHVAEMRRRNVLRRHRLEVEYVDGFLRRGDQLVERARRPDHGIGQPRRRLGRHGGEIGRGEQGARGEELQESAAARGLVVDRHWRPSLWGEPSPGSGGPSGRRLPRSYSAGSARQTAARPFRRNCPAAVAQEYPEGLRRHGPPGRMPEPFPLRGRRHILAPRVGVACFAIRQVIRQTLGER